MLYRSMKKYSTMQDPTGKPRNDTNYTQSSYCSVVGTGMAPAEREHGTV